MLPFMSGSRPSRMSMLRSAVSRHVSASWAIALMRMRRASRKMRRLTPTSARSSDLSVLSQAASSALASSSLFECASNALSEMGGFLPLSLTSCGCVSSWLSRVSLGAGRVHAHPRHKDVPVPHDDPDLCLSGCHILQAGSVVVETDEVCPLSLESLVKELADPVGGGEDVGGVSRVGWWRGGERERATPEGRSVSPGSGS